RSPDSCRQRARRDARPMPPLVRADWKKTGLRRLTASRPLRNAATKPRDPCSDALARKPITGIAPCCARAASGHAATMPTPKSVRNFLRLLCVIALPILLRKCPNALLWGANFLFSERRDNGRTISHGLETSVCRQGEHETKCRGHHELGSPIAAYE